MKIGCSAHIHELPAVEEAGFDYVELRGREVAALAPADLACLESQCERLPCLGLNAYCPPEIVIAGPGFDRRRAQTYAETLAARAVRLGVRVVGIGSPASRVLPEGFSYDLAAEQAKSFTKDTAEAFGRYGISVGFEALGYCFCNFINHMSEAAALVESLGIPSAGIILDFYNMELSGEAQLPFAPYISRILHVHLSDDLGTPDRRSFLRPEKLPLHEARVKALISAGYAGALTLEIDTPVDHTAKESLVFLRNLTNF